MGEWGPGQGPSERMGRVNNNLMEWVNSVLVDSGARDSGDSACTRASLRVGRLVSWRPVGLVVVIIGLLVCLVSGTAVYALENDVVIQLSEGIRNGIDAGPTLSKYENDRGFSHGRHLRGKEIYFDPALLGNSSLVNNITVYGAIIMSDAGEKLLEMTKTWQDADRTNVNNATDLAAVRSQHARQMYQQLPFPVVEWPPMFARPCPHHRGGHKTERGLAYAHYQIWLDFVFFDNDVLQAVERGEVKEENGYHSTSFSSISGSYVAYPNGTLTKYGVPFKEDDIIVIFEDDADIAIVDIQQTMFEELSTMNTDLLFLGWCVGRAARPVPLCAHAYALTRLGARKAVKYFEPCGLALDEQLVIMGKNKWLTYREAHEWSYRNRWNSDYPKAHDKNYGIFHQKRMGSFNGHR
jgi:hypothetical protein